MNDSLPAKASPIKWLVVGLVAVAMIVAGVLLVRQSAPSVKQMQQQLFPLGFFLFDSSRVLSPVPLTNLAGDTKPFDEHVGEWRLVNFGYMFCPDICPINLSLLNDVKKQWDAVPEVKPLNVIHVTFDPVRDTPDQLQAYLQYMNPDFYGLTGKVDDIRRFAQQLNTVFIHEKPDDQGHYFITHSDSMALINPNGEYIGMFKGPYNKDNMLEALDLLIR